MSDERRVKIPAHVFAREFDGELVVLDLAGGEYFGLNAVAAAMWAELSEGLSVGAVADRIAERYEVSVEDALHDVGALVETLRERGLVELAPGVDGT